MSACSATLHTGFFSCLRRSAIIVWLVSGSPTAYYSKYTQCAGNMIARTAHSAYLRVVCNSTTTPPAMLPTILIFVCTAQPNNPIFERYSSCFISARVYYVRLMYYFFLIVICPCIYKKTAMIIMKKWVCRMVFPLVTSYFIFKKKKKKKYYFRSLWFIDCWTNFHV